MPVQSPKALPHPQSNAWLARNLMHVSCSSWGLCSNQGLEKLMHGNTKQVPHQK